MIYLISLSVFFTIIILLVTMLLFLESKLVGDESFKVEINADEDKTIVVNGSKTLLSALLANEIMIPSACGGGGSCGMCKTIVEKGGGDVLPTELAHLSRKEKNSNVRLSCQMKVKNDIGIKIPESFFDIKNYDAIVISNNNVATYIKELVIKIDLPEKMVFKSGHYIQINVPNYSVSFSDFEIEDLYRGELEQYGFFDLKASFSKPGFRAYSLANAGYEEDVLMLTVRIATPPGKGIQPGFGSSYIFSLKQGDKISVSGPYGDFFVKETDREMCFVGGGAGMAPMRSHILDQLNAVGTKRKVSFWYGARSVKEMFYDEEFKDLAEKYDNFSYHVALSDPQSEDNWDGLTGFIHQCLCDSCLMEHEDPSEIEYYLCGPGLMIDAVIDMLDSLGVEEEMIAYDKF
jgi:Na+-transporting NADH:ubiquinone oxidoreductase subunit F